MLWLGIGGSRGISRRTQQDESGCKKWKRGFSGKSMLQNGNIFRREWSKRYNIQIYIESESGICQESEPISKSMLQDGYIFRKWDWKENNDIEMYWESDSENKVMIFKHI